MDDCREAGAGDGRAAWPDEGGVDAETEQVLSCAILGLEGGELMPLLQIAILGTLPYTALRGVVFAHPTLAESSNNPFATLDD